MRLSFDYYRNLEKADLYLCNPDGRELFLIPGRDCHIKLRFNDISEFSFVLDNKYTDRSGNDVLLEVYDYVRTKRLVYITNIGWFRISKVDEVDDGTTKQKEVIAESYQVVFKDKGFITEERGYCFYNEHDPYDDGYDHTNEEHIPSVVGQLHKQLGIAVDLDCGAEEPETAYADWTITYISEEVKGLHRSFKNSTTYGYDFMVNDAENAFKVVFVFDFLFKTIHIKAIDEVRADKTGVVYSFNNFMKSVKVSENDDDIVTVLNCTGGNCDITAVNPSGTNYLCDFSYYMDEKEHKWMSQELIDKLKLWQKECTENKDEYTEAIGAYRKRIKDRLAYEEQLKRESTFLTDLQNAHDNRSILTNEAKEGDLCGVVRAESVLVGNYSLDVDSEYESVTFSGDSMLTAYVTAPEYTEVSAGVYRWIFSGDSRQGTADSIISSNIENENSQYLYFDDCGGKSYCKLTSKAQTNVDGKDVLYECKGFDRFIAMRYPIEKIDVVVDENGVENGTRQVQYVDSIQTWIDAHESRVYDLNESIAALNEMADEAMLKASTISSRLNIITYFSDTPALLKELGCYWIEGTYSDDNISVLDTTTPDEEIELSQALMESGSAELAKVSQPRFYFSIESIDASKNIEFCSQMSDIEVGKLFAIEKEDGLWYYPVLLELSMGLDDVEDYSMTFANALRLDDWGYTYADLIKESSSTSRQVSANWRDLTRYTKEREKLQAIAKDPLNPSLRAEYANSINQEFVINSSSILGRKKSSDEASLFEPEQMRLVNNALLFTDDNWKTVKTALGKIQCADPTNPSKTITRYGLSAEVIVGDFILGKLLRINNSNSSIVLDEQGITIKKTPSGDGSSDDVVFKVDTSGNICVGNIVKNGELQAGMMIEAINNETVAKIKANRLEFEGETLNIHVDATHIKGKLQADQIAADAIRVESLSASKITSGTSNEPITLGAVTVLGGRLGNWRVWDNNLRCGDISTFFPLVEDLRQGVDGRGVLLSPSSGLGDGDNAIGGISIGCCPVPAMEAYDATYHQQFLIGGKHIFRSRWSSQCYGLNIEARGIYFYRGEEDVPIAGALSTSYISNSSEGPRLMGTWKTAAGIEVTSARSCKNSIEDLGYKHSILFDNLKPRAFKYNDGESGRIHYGLIVDELRQALDEAGLSTVECAAYCLSNTNEPNGAGGIRYSEIVPLCVREIQLLKKEIEALKSNVKEDI